MESLAQTDSRALKRNEIEGFVKKWQYAKFLHHISMYLNVLVRLKELSVRMQQERHDPLYVITNYTALKNSPKPGGDKWRSLDTL